MKRILSIVCALLLTAGFTLPAFAAEAAPTGNFMEGMMMLPGAKGENAEVLALALYRWEATATGVTRHLTNYVNARKALWYDLRAPEKILKDAACKYGYSDVPKEGFLFCSAILDFKQALALPAPVPPPAPEPEPEQELKPVPEINEEFLDTLVQKVTEAAGEEAGEAWLAEAKLAIEAKPAEEPPAAVQAIPSEAVDGPTWRALGLEVKDTFEAAFKSWSGEWAGGGWSPIKVKLVGDTLTLDYSPKIFVCPEFGLSAAEIDDVAAQCVDGFKLWEVTRQVYGKTLTIKVDVHPTQTTYKMLGNVKVLPKSKLASMVPGCILWRPKSTILAMYVRSADPVNGWIEDTTMHEFGHVLGLFDAYGYGPHFRGMNFLGLDLSDFFGKLLPEAPLERAPRGCIMRSGSRVTETEAEMLLWAWKSGHLQLFTESVLTKLGAQESMAFWY